MTWMVHLSDEKFGREGTGKCGGESTSANCTCQCCSLLNKLISIIPLCLSLLSVSEGLWMAGGKQANLTVILKMFFSVVFLGDFVGIENRTLNGHSDRPESISAD